MNEYFHLPLDKIVDSLRALGLFIQDLENNTALPNELWTAMGYTEEEMRGSGFLKIIHPDDRERVRQNQENFLTSRDNISSIQFRVLTREGDYRWILSNCIALKRDAKGRVIQYMGFDHDITEEAEAKIRVEKALIEAETLRSVTAAVTSSLNQQAVINAILEQAVRVISFSSASVQLLSGRELEIVGGIGFPDDFPVEGLRFTITHDTPNVEVIEKKKALIVNRDLIKKYPAFIDRAKTEIKSWMGVPLVVSGKSIGMIAFDSAREDGFSTADLDLAQAFGNQVAIALENARLYEETKKQAITDPLTGSFSRRYLYTSLTKLSSMAFRTGSPLSLILFDVDDFKIFNDRYGHQLGDEVLKIVVELTDTVLRKTDILCRYGGEEFVILLPQTGPEEAHAIAERIRKKVESQAILPGIDRAVTISLGWSLFQSSDFSQIDHFIYRADRALYAAKNSGKNRTAGPSDIPADT